MTDIEERIKQLSPEKKRLLELKMSQANAAKSSMLLVLQKGDSSKRHPVFCLHPPLGVTGYYANIVRYLDKDQPVYGLQCPVLYDQHPAFDNYEEMASYYLQQVKTVQPEPPYLFIGHSSGACTAYEMALQANREQQGACPLMVIVDQEAPMGQASGVLEAYRTEDLLENDQTMFLTCSLVALAHQQELTFRMEELMACAAMEDKHALVGNYLRSCGFLPQAASDSMVSVVMKMIASHAQADYSYYEKHNKSDAIDQYSGHSVLYRCTEQTYWHGLGVTTPPDESGYANWDLFCSGQLESIRIQQSDHLTLMMEPRVQELAESIQNKLSLYTEKNA